MHVHLQARQTTIPPYMARCITRWLHELWAGRTDIIQAHLTLVKYSRRSYTPYEAHLNLVLDGPVLFTMHPGQTQIEAVQSVLRVSVQQLQEWPDPSQLCPREEAREYGRLRTLRRQCGAEYLAPSEARTAEAPGSPALHGVLRWI
jgi:hypothetical protein